MRWFRQPPVELVQDVVLVIDDEHEVHEQVRRALVDFPWRLRSALTRADAHRVLDEERRVIAALVDLFMGDGGDELELVHAVRSKHPAALCAAFTGRLAENHINAVMAAGGRYICKYDIFQYLPRFARQVLVAKWVSSDALQACVNAHADKWHLTPRDIEIVAIEAEGVIRKRDRLAALAMKKGTYKYHVRQILDRSGQDSLEDVVCLLRAEARGL